MFKLNKFTLGLVLLLTSVACMADDAISREWSRLIKADFPDGCVSQLDEYLISVGANGIRIGAWLVQTCKGNFEYGARYVPADVHADKEKFSVSRKQEIRELTPEQLKTLYGIKR
ncbi:hypothetical protein [Pseudomonas rubra]|uniref:Uncharacterized protein n=1 Tax=Pseudomonas rubra TaxID=2942627 RepID=A0ABT5PAJ3_9PSED|nr:hypothetical protein [Pseudomonas rubra]MDD1015202.1 hypothetical protein [Pseudomonas rubra]MDD1037856.1 hypothetical protein [Pseudomonas rubra]MDD1152816.1 hypothetical protein [Pseudomonas rubra]